MISLTNPPDYLFHYTTADGLLGILSSKVIWATKITYLNDSKELSRSISLCKQHLEDLKKTSAYPDTMIDELVDELETLEHINLCICSFTEKGDLLSQWRAYSGSSNGYAIGFRFSELEELVRKAGFELVQCIYSLDLQKEMIEKFIDDIVPKMMDPKDPTDMKTFQEKFLGMAALFKDPGFEEEKEWRAISPVLNTTHTQFKFRASSSTIIPYYEIPLDFDKKHLGFHKIIIGPTPHPDLARMSIILLHFKYWGKTVGIANSLIPLRKF